MPLTSSPDLLLVKSKHNQKRREYSKITKHVEKIIPEGIWKPSAWDSPCAHPTDVNSERWMLWWQTLVLLASKETAHPAGQRAGFARSKLALRLAKTLSAGKSQSWVLAARGKGKKKKQGKIRQDKPEHVQFVLPTLQLYPHSSEQKAVQRHNKSLSSLTLLRNVMEMELKWFPEIRWQNKIKPFPTATLW